MKLIRPIWTLAPLLALTPAVFASSAQERAPLQDKTAGQVTPKAPAPMKETGAAIGSPAPDFTLKDVDGKTVKLSDYKGKTIVLEWFNPGCPFVVAAHGKDGELAGMSTKVAADGVVWLSINSSAAGKEGSGAEMNKKMRDEWKIKNPVLLDESGDVGRMYGAKSTPHMFVIDAKGMLVYRGALDNAPMGKVDGPTKMNYVAMALADLKAGKPVATKETKSYGCSVKYAVKP